jgi:3-hydroxyisobutyrate dehydrogenase
MGIEVCARVVQARYTVTATDLRPELEPVVVATGARWAGSVAEVASRCDVVITVLPGPAEVSAVIDPMVEALAPGSTWIDLSSATPEVADRIARAAQSRGVRTLDAPVGGGPEVARSGRLLVFAGGDAGVLEVERELLEAFASRVLHVGAAGSGYAVKLLVNLLWFGQAVAASEALALATRCGVDPEEFRRAVQESAAASRFMAIDAPALLRGDDMQAFSLSRCVDELEAVLALARQLDAPFAIAGRVTELYADALERYGDVAGELLAARLVAERSNVRFGEHPDASGQAPAAPALDDLTLE